MSNARLAEWRAGQRETLVLPSGLSMTVRRVSLLDLAAAGQVPAPLMGMVERLIGEGQRSELELATLPQFVGLIDAVIMLAAVDPPLAAEPDEDHIGVHELPTLDKVAVFNWLNAPAAALAPFRPGPSAALPSAPAGPDVRDAAVGDPGG